MSIPKYIQRRGEILAELFVQDLKPKFFASAGQADETFDYFAGFETATKRQVVITIEVKCTEQPVQETYIFNATGNRRDRLANSNVPTLVVIVNVKEDEVHFGWASQATFVNDPSVPRTALVRLPVKKATAQNKLQLKREIEQL